MLKLSREESEMAWGGNHRAVAAEDWKLQCEKVCQTEKPEVKEEVEGAAAEHRKPRWNENLMYFAEDLHPHPTPLSSQSAHSRERFRCV